MRGVGIVLIGLNLAGSAINNIQTFENFTPGYYWSWGIALFVCLLAIILSSYGKGMLKMSSIVISLVSGYLVTLIAVETGLAPEGLTDFAKVSAHSWLELPDVTLPTFDFAGRGDQILRAVASVAPIAIVTVVEHVGDVYANGAVVGRDFTKDPGLHRTMLGDGLATMAAGYARAARRTRPTPKTRPYSPRPATTTPSRCVSPRSSPSSSPSSARPSAQSKRSRPACSGGACIVLYGMISSVGLRTLVENHVDFTKNRNLCIAAVMLVLAIGEAVIGGPNFSLTNIGLGIIAGILLNLILPEPKETDPGLIAHTVEESEIVEERK